MTLAKLLKTRGNAQSVSSWKKAPTNYYKNVKKGVLSQAFNESLLKDENKRFTRDITKRYAEEFRQIELYNALSVFTTYNSEQKRDSIYYSMYGIETEFTKALYNPISDSENAFNVFSAVC